MAGQRGYSLGVLLLLLFLGVGAAVVEAKPKAPEWLQAAMARTSPLAEDAEAVIIEDYSRITHKSRNRVEDHTRLAVRILDKDERGRAVVEIPLRDKHSKVRDFRAWMVYPSGRVEAFKERDTIELAANRDALQSEAKVLRFDRVRSVRAGCVFAYEYTLQRRTVFVQHHWYFQGRMPSLRSRFELALPKGWSLSTIFFKEHGGIQSGQSKGVHFWEARNLPGIEDEPQQKPLGENAVSMAVQATPTAKEKARYDYLSFNDWGEVARCDYAINLEPTEPTAEIVAKAWELTADKTTPWEKIQAICDFTQTVNYLAISIDLEEGGGFKPRPAAEVLETHWGDCKDMSALTVAMLRGIGLEAYTVGAKIGPDDYIAPEWPSMTAFNHCIVAIPLEQPVSGSAVVQCPDHGRVVIFDPTDQYTPVGHLPDALFDGRVLIGSEQSTGLLELPRAQPKDRHLVQRIEASLGPTGTIEAMVREEVSGFYASYLRRVVRTSSEKELREFVHGWISNGAPRAVIEDISFEDDFRSGRFAWEVRFSAKAFARSMAGASLFTFKPVFLTALQWVPPEDEERMTDYISGAWSIEQEMRFALPEDYALENLPEARSLNGTYGYYSLQSSKDGGAVVIERHLKSFPLVIPSPQYPDLVDFYLQIHRADSAQIVLKAVP